VREYALGILASERVRLERRHALYFLALAEEADARFFGADHGSTIEGLDADYDNFLAALDTLHREQQWAEELRLAGALWKHWFARGHPTEARRRLADALDASNGHDHPARIPVLYGAASLAWRQGDLETAEQLASETRRLARRLGDERGEAMGLGVVGIAARQRGELEAAGEHLSRAARLYRQAANRRGYAIALLNLAGVEMDRRRPAVAERLCRRALRIFRGLGDTIDQAQALGNLGMVAVERGGHERAEEYFHEGLRLAVEVGFTERIADALVGLAAIAASRGESARAASRLGAASAFRDDAGYVPERLVAALQEQTEASIRSTLGRVRYEALVDEGRSRPWEVVAQA
jgi:tetratricopeptide (TPR) repeat protein